MWSLAVVIVLAGVVWRGKRRSGLPWPDFWIAATSRCFARIWHRMEPVAYVPWPREGPIILVSNHTCGADPAYIVSSLGRLPSFFVSREHYRVHPWIGALLDYLGCIAVRREGPDPAALRKGLRRLAEGRPLVIFPEAGLSGVGRNRIRPPRPGMALLALRSGAPVFPLFIAGGPRTHDLVASWLLPSGKRLRLVLGPAVDLEPYRSRPRDRALLEEVTELLMRRILELDPRASTSSPAAVSAADAVG